MTPQTQKVPRPWREAYRDHLTDLTFLRLRVGSLIVVFAVVLDGVAEAVIDYELFGRTFWIRAAVASIGLVVFVCAQTGMLRRSALFLTYLLAFAVAMDVEVAVLSTGGAGSPFYAGFLLLLVGMGLLFPLTAGQTALAAGLVWVVYAAPLALVMELVQWRAFVNNAFFLVIATVLAVAASKITSTLRQREFMHKQALREEQEKSERLLLNVLPRPIAERLKNGQTLIADGESQVTVLFADIVGFTQLASRRSPEKLVGMLNELFTLFDDLTEKHGIEKIKTIGDAYMAAGGLGGGDGHAASVIDFALEIMAAMEPFRKRTGEDLNLRVGVHTGPVVAGVIGKKKFSYDLWGDTVNTASRMESGGAPGRIQISSDVYDLLRDEYECAERGEIDVKGKGVMKVYFLVGQKNAL